MSYIQNRKLLKSSVESKPSPAVQKRIGMVTIETSRQTTEMKQIQDIIESTDRLTEILNTDVECIFRKAKAITNFQNYVTKQPHKIYGTLMNLDTELEKAKAIAIVKVEHDVD